MKQCTTCQENKPLDDYYIKDRARGRRATVCKSCASKRSCSEARLRKQNNSKLVAKAQRGGCSNCSETRGYVLDFHHRDPKQKELNIANGTYQWSEEKLQAEIDKCDVLCANCHRAEHYHKKNRTNT